MLLSEENKSTCCRLEGRRLHLCPVECVYLFIKVERAGYLLKVRVPAVILFLPPDKRGRPDERCMVTVSVELQNLQALHCPPQIFMIHTVCAVSGPWSQCGFFPLMCAQYVHRCFGSGGASSAERKREDGWGAGWRGWWVCLHVILSAKVASRQENWSKGLMSGLGTPCCAVWPAPVAWSYRIRGKIMGEQCIRVNILSIHEH